jgi:hypothetical protein
MKGKLTSSPEQIIISESNKHILKRMSEDMRLRGMSEHTQDVYIRYAGKFMDYCGKPAE